MPSKSKKQHDFFCAVAHNKKFAKKVGVKQSVGKEFCDADKGKKFESAKTTPYKEGYAAWVAYYKGKGKYPTCPYKAGEGMHEWELGAEQAGIENGENIRESADVAMTAAKELFKQMKMASRYATDQGNEPEVNGNMVEYSVRDFGQWINPPGEEDDEDYDWQIPSDETIVAVQKIVKSVSERFNVKIQFSFEEKNWIYFSIRENIISEGFVGVAGKIMAEVLNG
jgi:hypothetical protein